MIFRLSQKMSGKIKAGGLGELAEDGNPFADWSVHVFMVSRKQYVLVCNTRSLYSTVVPGKGITDGRRLVEVALKSLREFMEEDGRGEVYHRWIAPACGSVQFSKALNRSVTGSMNELIACATLWLIDGDMSIFEVGFRLNDLLLSTLGGGVRGEYGKPREAFQAMVEDAGRGV